MQTEKEWTPDESQQAVIGTMSGRHLVLAPPGCGKTQILAERVRRAHAEGVAYADMLCLTFTNRAARGMRERIGQRIDDDDVEDVFVGNVHRFCSRFLFENGIVPAESAIIDDDTVVSIVAMYLQEDEERVKNDFNRRRYYSQIMFCSHLMEEVEERIPRELRQHPDCLSRDDVQVLRALSKAAGKEFTAESMVDIYDHNDFYQDIARSEAFDLGLKGVAETTLHKLKYAHAYAAYKRQNNLLDFEDLLIMTYIALRDSADYRRYPWIQVDEVQDLNPLQLAIIDSLSTTTDKSSTEKGHGVLIYLGDEQQAIFSFMGAKLSTLTLLKDRCQGNVHHLSVNHRSPRYLVDMLNRYAIENLHTDPALLPQPDNDDRPEGQPLQIMASDNLQEEYQDVAHRVAALREAHPKETTAVIVNSNKDADAMSRALDGVHEPHFKVSGSDLFAQPSVKLLMAHLSVLANEHNFLAWSRLMYGLHICQTNASARQFVHQLSMRGITPTDFLGNDEVTYLQRFLRAYEENEIVVFDTETTGLNVFEDDVIQIAAEKIRQGKTIDKFCIYIETDRRIPDKLGDTVNPIIEERRHQRIYTHAYALRKFLDFVGSDVVLGHNVQFDFHIMDNNILRYLSPQWPEGETMWKGLTVFDSLKLIRLLRPDLKAFKLKLLLQELHLEGANTHLADDDVFATVSLTGYCYRRGQELVDSQQEYLSRKTTKERIRAFRDVYRPLYAAARQHLYHREKADCEPALVAEMKRMAQLLHERGWVMRVPKADYIYRFLTDDVIDKLREPSLVEQLDRHIMELNTFKEADLCGSSTITDRVFVSTIHKAKGLEFDNVIVFDVVDGRIPNYYNEGIPTLLAEDARKLYVAMSRARRRLTLWWSRSKVLPREVKLQRLSRFVNPRLFDAKEE